MTRTDLRGSQDARGCARPREGGTTARRFRNGLLYQPRTRRRVIAGTNNVINLGNGADTVYAAKGDTITVGNGHDTFVFGLSPGQTTAGMIGPVTINHFSAANDVIQIASTLPGGWDTSFTSLSPHIQTISGNAVITLDTSGDTITLVGVQASALHASDFHFV